MGSESGRHKGVHLISSSGGEVTLRGMGCAISLPSCAEVLVAAGKQFFVLWSLFFMASSLRLLLNIQWRCYRSMKGPGVRPCLGPR